MSSDRLAPRRPPHITVNSGRGGNLLDNMRSDSSSSTATQGNSGQLIPNQQYKPYSNSAVAESLEILLAPSRARGPRPYQDIPNDSHSRSQSAMSSRRTSWSSSGSRDSRHGPFATPFDDPSYSRSSSRVGDRDSDEELGMNTQTVSEKYSIIPSAGLLLYPEDVEKDDYLHNPSPDDKDEPRCDVFSKRGMMNIGGLAIITLGVLTLFIGYPVLYASFQSC